MTSNIRCGVCAESPGWGTTKPRSTVARFVSVPLLWLAATVADPSSGIAAGSPQPFAFGFAAINSHPASLVSTATTVPAGFRWTIQNISIVCFVPNGTSISSIDLTTSTNGVVTGITPAVPESKFFSNSPHPSAVVQLSQPTLTYADPGTLVAFQAFLQATAPPNQFSCAVDLMGLATPTAGSLTGGVTTGSGAGVSAQ